MDRSNFLFKLIKSIHRGDGKRRQKNYFLRLSHTINQYLDKHVGCCDFASTSNQFEYNFCVCVFLDINTIQPINKLLIFIEKANTQVLGGGIFGYSRHFHNNSLKFFNNF